MPRLRASCEGGEETIRAPGRFDGICFKQPAGSIILWRPVVVYDVHPEAGQTPSHLKSDPAKDPDLDAKDVLFQRVGGAVCGIERFP